MFDVLVFIDWYLPGYRAGGPVTSCANMVQALQGKVRFHIVTRNTDYCSDVPYEISPNKWIKTSEGVQVMYLSDDRLSLKNMQRLISDTHCDVIYINGIYSKYFSIYPLLANRQLRQKEKRVIVASRGMLSQSALGIKKFKKNFFLIAARIFGLYRNVDFHATNAKEEQDIRKGIGKHPRIFIASNISKALAQEPVPIDKNPGELKIVSIARISPEKNLLFLIESLAALESQVALNIYGSVYDEQYWQKCLQRIATLPANVQVNYRGLANPLEIEGIIQQNHVLSLPSLGENFGHVIAESFLAGRPVVISDQTPWKGLKEEKAGFDLPLNPQKFEEAFTELAAMNKQQFEEWCAGARQLGSKLAADTTPVDDHLKMFLNPSS